jgi:hypothetical protein
MIEPLDQGLAGHRLPWVKPAAWGAAGGFDRPRHILSGGVAELRVPHDSLFPVSQ